MCLHTHKLWRRKILSLVLLSFKLGVPVNEPCCFPAGRDVKTGCYMSLMEVSHLMVSSDPEWQYNQCIWLIPPACLNKVHTTYTRSFKNHTCPACIFRISTSFPNSCFYRLTFIICFYLITHAAFDSCIRAELKTRGMAHWMSELPCGSCLCRSQRMLSFLYCI